MDQLLPDIKAFMAAHGMSRTAFGLNALNDRHLVKQLEKGRRIWPETEAKIRRFMATYRKEAA